MLPEMKERKVGEKHITSCLKSWYTDTLCISNFLQTENSRESLLARTTVKLDTKVNSSSVNMPPGSAYH